MVGSWKFSPPDAFYIGAHRDVYRAALGLHAKGQPADLMTVTMWLKDHNKLEDVGGQARIAQLVDRTVSAANIDQYAALVMDKYTRRLLIPVGGGTLLSLATTPQRL